MQKQGLPCLQAGQIGFAEIDELDAGTIELHAAQIGSAQVQRTVFAVPFEGLLIEIRAGEIDVLWLWLRLAVLDGLEPVLEGHGGRRQAIAAEEAFERLDRRSLRFQGEDLAEEVEGFERDAGHVPLGVGFFFQGADEVAGEEVFLQGGVGEAEAFLLGVWPQDEGGRAEVFLEKGAVLVGVGSGQGGVLMQEVVEPVLQAVHVPLLFPAAPERGGQSLHEAAFVRGVELVLAIITAEPGADDEVVKPGGIDGLAAHFQGL